MATGYSEEQIDAMRDWVADCYNHDIFFDIDDVSDREVIAEVRSNYGGGMRQFMVDCGYWEHDVSDEINPYNIR